MKRNSKSTLLIFSFILLLFNSCMSDVDLLNISNDLKIDQSLVIPVGEAKVTINDIFRKLGVLPTGIDTLSTEIYYQNISSMEYSFKPVNLSDSIKPFDKTLALKLVSFTFDANQPIVFPSISDTLPLGINSNTTQQRIDIIKMSSSLLSVNFDASDDIKAIPANDILVEFVFPPNKLKIDNGINIQFRPLAYGQITPIPAMGSYSIFPNGDTKIPFKINVSVRNQPIQIKLDANSYIKIKLTFDKIVLSEAWGKFKLLINDMQSTQFDLGKFIPNGYLRFESPTIDISATSNIGVDLALKLDYLRTSNSLSTPVKYEQAWFNNHTTNTTNLYLTGPSVVGTTVSNTLTQFNNTNGEIDKLINTNPYPNTIDFKYSVSDNPLPGRTINFITADSKVKFDLKTRFKMSLKDGSNYTLKDTIKNVGQGLGAVLDGVDSAVMVLNFSNGLPIKAFYRMTFCKSDAPNDTIACNISNVKNDSVFGTIFSRYQLNAPDVNADGTVKTGGIKTQTLQIGLSKNMIADLKNTKFIAYTVSMAGDQTVINGVPTTNPIHLTTKNSFGVKLGVFIKANATVTLNKKNITNKKRN